MDECIYTELERNDAFSERTKMDTNSFKTPDDYFIDEKEENAEEQTNE